MQGSVGDPSAPVRSPSLAPVSVAAPGEALEMVSEQAHPWASWGHLRAHLDNEASGRALPDPEAEFPLFPLSEFPLRARGNEHRVFINQGFM